MRASSRKKAGGQPQQDPTGDLFASCARHEVVVPVSPAPRLQTPQPRLAPPPRQLWLALGFPQLARVALDPATDPSLPAVVTAGEGGACAIVACNDAAAKLGIGAGLALNAARVLVPMLHVRGREPLRERRHLEGLAHYAMSRTPFVSLEPPDALLLEVQGSLGLFGGLTALLEGLCKDLAARAETVTIGVAPTPRAALWIARGAPGQIIENAAMLAGRLARLPLTVTGWPERTLEACTRLGVATLGELRRLPRDGLARRFEGSVLTELDEAYGERPTPRRRHVLAERFTERLELPAECEGVDHLGPCCADLLGQLAQFLRVRDAGVVALAFMFLHRDQKPSCVRLGRALPAASAADWQGLLAERLPRVSLAAPVCAIVLRSGSLMPLAGTSGELQGCGTRTREAEALRLLDRLRARLGETTVQGLRLVSEHRPEAAYRRVRAELPPARSGGARLPQAARPMWLLEAPEPLDLEHGEPWHRGALRLESGPERIESGWWDGAGIARDYYVARTTRGVRLWIFRGGTGDRGWFLHGVFG